MIGQGTYAFYDQRLPAEIYDGVQLARWMRESPEHARQITMTKADLLAKGRCCGRSVPRSVGRRRPWELPLDYKFEPGQEHDGVTVTVPLEARIRSKRNRWPARPGLLEEKVLAMIRSLPKALRTRFAPRPKRPGGPWRSFVTARETCPPNSLGPSAAWRRGGCRHGLRGRTFAARAADERPCDRCRRPDAGGRQRPPTPCGSNSAAEAAKASAAIDDPSWNRDGLTTWDFDDLPAEIDVAHGGLAIKAYPALIDGESSVGLRLLDSPNRAAYQ